MPTAREADAGKLIPAVAVELKKIDEIKPHPLAGLVKGGLSNERPPEQPDYWYLRSAAILRKIYLRGPVGTQRLRTAFGGKRRRGHKPAHHQKAGGKFIRLILQQLEKGGLVAKVEKPKKGRAVTAKGQKLLDRAAARIARMGAQA